jgi:hypothetical protein
LIEVKVFGNKKGSTTRFMQSHLEQQPKIAEIVDFLGGLRIFTNAETKAVD